MNALYVTVSVIPLILVLAGFNHAHGLTTFGKSNNQQSNAHQQTIATGKPCTNQANCTFIKGTTCLRSYCLCGDNSHPINGICSAIFKGPKHLCQKDDECVDGAICVEQETKPHVPAPNKNNSNNNNNNNNPVLVCQCTEGLTPTPGGQCSGGNTNIVVPGLLVLFITLLKFY
ncbi:hypothetical protein JTB14_019205 [Gonioctena quinquepunctata]|nr:hypothetical protein JTB14_019205 [Gonioctena quinquepunctata]